MRETLDPKGKASTDTQTERWFYKNGGLEKIITGQFIINP